MSKKTYQDDSEHFDYVADVLHPTMRSDKRVALAEICMEAYTENGDLTKYHPKAAYVVEQLAIRLMGTDWCQTWLKRQAQND